MVSLTDHHIFLVGGAKIKQMFELNKRLNCENNQKSMTGKPGRINLLIIS